MTIGYNLEDPVSKKRARVNNENAVYVINEGVPIFGQSTTQIIFRDYFRDSNGSNNMVVSPPAGGTEFIIPASPGNDRERYISSLSFVIADAGASPNQFGNIGVLTNGIDIEYTSTETETGIVSLSNGGFTTNFDFIRLAGGEPSFGQQTNAFRSNNVIGNAEAYIPFVDLRKIFGIENPVKLRAGTADKFVIRINDDLTGVTEFTCIASGFDRINPPS